MAARSSQGDGPTVDVHEDAGVSAQQAKPTADMSAKEVKESLAFSEDKTLHPTGDPEHAADATSVPGPEYPPLNRPPVATTRPDEPIVKSLATGAGAHVPPPADEYDAAGRIRD